MTLDELVTKYTLDDQSYKKGAQSILTATQRVHQSIDKLGMSLSGGLSHAIASAFGPKATSAVDSFKASITGGLSSALHSVFNPISALVGGAGLLGLAKFSLDAAVNFEYLNRSLAGVVGSAQRAASVLSFVQKLAGPSMFTRNELAEAATRLEAFGLTTEKYLPSVEKMATLFGGTTDKLMEFVDALGRIKGGMTGRGFEILETAGLSRDVFKTLGLQFSKQGELLSPINQALDTVIKAIQTRFGALNLAGTAKAKLSSFMDAVQEMAQKAGKPLMEILAPAIEKVSSFVSYLAESGVIESVAKSLVGMFGGKDIGTAMIGAIGYLIASLQEIPGILRVIKYGIENVFQWIILNAKTIGTVLLASFVFGPIVQVIRGLIAAITTLRAAHAAGSIVAQVWAIALTGGTSALAVLTAMAIATGVAVFAMNQLQEHLSEGIDIHGLGAITARIEKTQKGFMDGFNASLVNPTATAVTDQAGTSTPAMTQSTSLLDQIEKHTKETAQNTSDFSTHALGGGNLGKIGITKAELHTIRNQRDIKISVNGGEFSHAIQSFLYDALRQLRSEGSF